ncbi:MAG: methyltransferase domain-containing protein [Candidatus Bruticola sp.]
MFFKQWMHNFANPGIKWGGAYVLRRMNKEHIPLFHFASQFFEIPINGTVLDVGCGGGHHIAMLRKKCHSALIYGVDISPLSVKASEAYNKETVNMGLAKIVLGDVCDLPFSDTWFDVVTASETVYFWTDVEKAFNEIYRVLKPGGTVAVYCDSFDPEASKKHTDLIPGMRVYTSEELHNFVKQAKFINIKVNTSEDGKICLTAQKDGVFRRIPFFYMGNPYNTLAALWARALESRQPVPILDDQNALDVVSNINYDFSYFADLGIDQVGLAVRDYLIDRMLKNFLEKNHDVTIINLAPGLDTRLHRIPQKDYKKWIDIDVPLNLDLRRAFFSKADKLEVIAKNITDFTWIDNISKADEPKVIIAQDIFAYIELDTIKNFLTKLAHKFAHIDVIFDLPSYEEMKENHQLTLPAPDKTRKRNAKYSSKKMSNVTESAQRPRILWTLQNVFEVQKWCKAIRVVEERNLFDYDKKRWGWRGFIARLPKNRARMSHNVVQITLKRELLVDDKDRKAKKGGIETDI